jgi:hypothetical protein
VFLPLILVFSILTTLVVEAKPEGHIFYRNDEFISNAFSADQNPFWKGLGAHFDERETWTDSLFQVKLEFLVVPQQPLLNYVNFREIFIQWKLHPHQSLQMGRSLHRWSALDSDWTLGFWQPLFKWNPLNPEEQGLTGFFTQWWGDGDFGRSTLDFFASNIYIPNQGAKYEIDNGEFKKVNPWFKTPPAKMRLWGEDTDVKYNIILPSTVEVISQPSIAFKYQLNNEVDPGFFMRFAWAHKPSNQMAMRYRGAFDLSKNAGLVDIFPAVFNHSLTSYDLGWSNKNFGLFMGGLHDEPNSIVPLETWTTPQMSSLSALQVGAFVREKEYKLSFSELQFFGGKTELQGDLASSSGGLALVRYPFKMAYQLKASKIRVPSKINHNNWGAQLRWLMSEENELISADFEMNLYKNWLFFTEAQLIQAKEVEGGSLLVTDLNQFADNDRIGAGIRYEF